MDEQESIAPREAAMGLAILGLLTASLVGVIVLRIVQAAPHRAVVAPGTTWASDSSPALGRDPAEEPVGPEAQTAAATFPTDGDDHAAVQPVAADSVATEGDEVKPLVEETTPRFVVPANR